ncbi:MAG: serine O-acetyltransferase [Phycisphaerales bacterium]|nr:serine O-acetyltransferase [Phycisphaerales bacterium]
MSRYDGGALGDASWMEQALSALTRSIKAEGSMRLRGGAGGEGSAGWLAGRRDGFRAANVEQVRELVDLTRRVVFPGYFDADPPWESEIEPMVARACVRIAEILENEVRAVLRYGRRPPQHGGERIVPAAIDDAGFVHLVVREYLMSLAEVRRLLMLDVQAAFDGDPAAEHVDEIVLCYPGLEAIFVQRAAHVLYRLGVPVLPRVMGEQAHSRTGIDVHPGAVIGESFFIDHGSATVIGETSVIGKHVKIYQGVTLGARSFPKDERGRAIKGLKRHPTIGDRVTIYAGAVILGGDTVIGDDCVIAGGVFVTSSVAPGHVVQQTRPEPVLKPTGGAGNKGALMKGSGLTGELGWLADGAGI